MNLVAFSAVGLATIREAIRGYTGLTVPWMAWNIALAVLPWMLAVFLFERDRRPSPLWWIGVAACLALLPNAAYVLTDVVHLPSHVRSQPSDAVVIAVVLPMFAALFAIGFLAYVDTVRRMATWVAAMGWVRRRWLFLGAVHAATVTGVYLGRVHRFNSWDLVLRPLDVLRVTAAGLSRPVAIAGMTVLFVFLAVGYTLAATVLEMIRHPHRR